MNDISTQSRVRPKLVELEITNWCNLRCTICERGNQGYVQEPKKNMTFEEFKKMMDQYDYSMDAVQIGGTSEPTINPDLAEMIKYLVARKQPGKVELITNATLLARCLSRALIKAGLTSLRASVDGPDKITYSAIRTTNLNLVVRNLKAFDAARVELRKKEDISFYINCVIVKDNVDSIVNMPRFTHDVGADFLELRLFETNLQKLGDKAVHEKDRLDRLRTDVQEEADRWHVGCDFWDFQTEVLQCPFWARFDFSLPRI